MKNICYSCLGIDSDNYGMIEACDMCGYTIGCVKIDDIKFDRLKIKFINEIVKRG